MLVLLISGSKNQEGRTARAIETIEKGVIRAGGDTDKVFLSALNLERCRQCNSDGWGRCREEGICIIDDDFSALADKIKGADVVVFASPVYFMDLTESMKAFLDRLRRTSAFSPEKPHKGISAVALCLAGGGGGGSPSACFLLERTLNMCGFDVVDTIPLRRQNFEAKLPTLAIIGEWLAGKPTSDG